MHCVFLPAAEPPDQTAWSPSGDGSAGANFAVGGMVEIFFPSLPPVHRRREEGITKHPYWCKFEQPLSSSCRGLSHHVDCNFLASVTKCKPCLILRYAALGVRVSQSATTAFSNCRKAAPKGSSSSWAQ